MSVKDVGWTWATNLSSADRAWRAIVASYSLQAASTSPPTNFGPNDDRIQADPAVPKMYVTAYATGMASTMRFFSSSGIASLLMASAAVPRSPEMVWEPARSPAAWPTS